MLKKPTLMLRCLALVFVLSCTSLATAEEIRIVESISSAEMKSIIEQEGFPGVTIDGDDDLVVKFQGYDVLVFVRGNDYSSIRYRFAISGSDATLRDVNAWNRSKLFTKASLDDDGDPVLEMEIDLEGGVRIERIRDSIRSWNESLATFIREVV